MIKWKSYGVDGAKRFEYECGKMKFQCIWEGCSRSFDKWGVSIDNIVTSFNIKLDRKMSFKKYYEKVLKEATKIVEGAIKNNSKIIEQDSLSIRFRRVVPKRSGYYYIFTHSHEKSPTLVYVDVAKGKCKISPFGLYIEEKFIDDCVGWEWSDRITFRRARKRV